MHDTLPSVLLLRLIALLVPRRLRAHWIEEWTAEIRDARERGIATGWWGLGRMLHGALNDARATRRHGAALSAARGIRWTRELRLEGLYGDLRQATRALRSRPAFTGVAVLTLGLGIGAATAMFSAVHAVLLRPLPYADADRVVILKRSNQADGSLAAGVPAADVRDLAERARTLEHVALADGIHGLRLVKDGRAESLRTWVVSRGFFEAIGAQTQLGRAFVEDEFVAGNERVVILGHHTWQTRFGGAADVIGQQVTLDGAAHTIIGIMPAQFGYPSRADAWTPRPPQPKDDAARGSPTMHGVARLARGVSLTDARTEVARIASGLAAVHPASNAETSIELVPLRRHLLGDVRTPLLLLLGAVGLVLLAAAANVAGLQLARGASRSREYALRAALGASSARVLRLVLTESLLLAACGGVLGVALAVAGTGVIETLAADHLPRVDGLRVDATVLAFAVGITVFSAVVAGVTPALHAARANLQSILAGGSRGSTQGPGVVGLRDRFVIAEIALALVLTIGAGLLVRSLDHALQNELGFDPHNRLTFQVWSYDDQHRARLGFFDAAADRVRELPGVRSVGMTTDLPFADGEQILSPGRTAAFDLPHSPSRTSPTAAAVGIDDGFAAAMGIRVVRGRNVTDRDGPETPAVALVNEAFVRRYLSGREPIGVPIRMSSGQTREIVGVLADVRRQGFESEPEPEIYLPLAQEPRNGLTFVAHAEADPALLVAAVREALWAVDPNQAVWAMRPMRDLLADWLRQRRFNTALLTAFATLALILACIGVYGLTAFTIEQRYRELGVRKALGGRSADILAVVLRRVLVLGVIGSAIGVAGAIVFTRFLRGMLFGVTAFDAPTFGFVSMFVVGTAVVAALLPATRATRVDPLVVLSRVD